MESSYCALYDHTAKCKTHHLICLLCTLISPLGWRHAAVPLVLLFGSRSRLTIDLVPPRAEEATSYILLPSRLSTTKRDRARRRQ